jgi:hypothetical protein
MKNILLTLFLTLNPNADIRTKKTKNVFHKSILESHFILISGLGA